LFERLVSHHGLRNLVFVWSAAEPGEGAGSYADFFPGHDSVDALAVDVAEEGPRWGLDARLSVFGIGKPIGLGVTGVIPAPDVFSQQRWAWFLLGAATSAAPPAEHDAALRRLYAASRVVSRPAAPGPDASGPDAVSR
jgi:mannan endo-1,4-beta-mannosidase